ncbi:MAG: hypothetical protein IJ633_02535 [Prevotella sp.]|nr:hypothetical protein [Prevotella sp.]
MKKIFTLISMALVAMSVNAQEDPVLYPVKSVTWDDIKWRTDNPKTDINDEAGTKWYFVKGDGNAFKDLYAEEYTNQDDEILYRPWYTYIDYDNGDTGIPASGLYYKFTPSKAGQLKVRLWVNKDRRRTVIAKESTQKPMIPHTDYQIEGYLAGEYIKDAEGNNVQNSAGQNMARYFTNDEIKALHEAENAARAERGDALISDYVIGAGNKALWGYLIFNVEAGESYYVFQLSSQLGFGGYEFTPTGGEAEKYVAASEVDGTIKMADEFANAVDENGVAKASTITTIGSVINISTTNMAVEAVGSSVPKEVIPDKGESGISNVKAEDANAPIYNLAGQKADKSQKGILIQNGKKFVNK